MNVVERTQKTYDEVADQYLVRNQVRTEVTPSLDRFSRLLPDGGFEHLRPKDGEGLNTQQMMIEHRSSWRRKT